MEKLIVLLDVDDTLLDFGKSEDEAIRKTLAKFGRSSGFKNTLGFSRKLRILLLKIVFSREVL